MLKQSECHALLVWEVPFMIEVFCSDPLTNGAVPAKLLEQMRHRGLANLL
jgi:hypothetical protein